MEFSQDKNPEEVERKMRNTFPDLRKIMIGIDHRNFHNGTSDRIINVTSGQRVQKKLGDIIRNGGHKISEPMKCGSCGNQWPAQGWEDNDGKYANVGADVCHDCGGQGKFIEDMLSPTVLEVQKP